MLKQVSKHAYSVTRFVIGGLFTCHGAQKLFGVLGGHQATGNPRNLVGGLIEFIGGVLIALGLFTSIAAFIACGEMAVAYFQSHAPSGFWPILNHGELAVLYCFIFLYFVFEGDGCWSLWALFKGRFGQGI